MKEQTLTVLIDQAGLEAQKVNGKFEILTPDFHKPLIDKMGKKASDYKPELVHQCLLMLLDSPLNRAGKLKVYIRTCKNIIIKVNKDTRIPRTFNRFCGLMAQLMQKFKITASDNESKILMQVMQPPVTAYFPEDAVIYGISNQREKCVVPDTIVPPKDGKPMVVYIAATDKQDIMESCSPFVKDLVALSNYEMTAEFACFKICKVVHDQWIEESNEK